MIHMIFSKQVFHRLQSNHQNEMNKQTTIQFWMHDDRKFNFAAFFDVCRGCALVLVFRYELCSVWCIGICRLPLETILLIYYAILNFVDTFGLCMNEGHINLLLCNVRWVQMTCSMNFSGVIRFSLQVQWVNFP